MRILVTGGAGYIGSATVRRLLGGPHTPIVLDTLEHGHRPSIEGARLVVGDVRDVALVRGLLVDEGIEAVIHFAALKAVDESMTDPIRYLGTNVGGTLALLEAMNGSDARDIVFSSTCAVYGTPAQLPVRETAPLAPENPYGATKQIAEDLLRWSQAGGIRAIALRYFNAAGAAPGGHHGEDWTAAANLIPLVLRVALGRSPTLRIFGTDYPTPDGTAVRDYVHVDDLADAHVLALEHLVGGGTTGVLNLGTGRGTSVSEIVDLARSVTGRPIATENAPRRPGDPAAIWADTSLANDRLGWTARHDLRAIVESAWAWHSRHPDGYAQHAGDGRGGAEGEADGSR
ncbi:MAG: UDP-glucose 4-epimerase GalE [Chloroflexota bacterium]